MGRVRARDRSGNTSAGDARARAAGYGRRLRRRGVGRDRTGVASVTEWLRAALDAVDVDALVQLTGDLIRFPSVTPPGGEEAIARFVADRFRSIGLATELQPVAPGRLNAIGRLGPLGG